MVFSAIAITGIIPATLCELTAFQSLPHGMVTLATRTFLASS